MKILLALVALSAMCCLSLAHRIHGEPCYPGECDDGQNVYCKLLFSSCHRGTCDCYQGYVYSAEAFKCVLKKTRVNDACIVQEQCPTGTICTEKNKCECDPAFTTDSEEMTVDHMACRDTTLTVVIGEACTAGVTVCNSYSGGVFTPLGTGICVSNVCNCSALAAAHTENGLACVATPVPPSPLIGSACKPTDTCPIGSSCTGIVKICTCNAGVSIEGNTACKTNGLAENKKCDVANPTDGCADSLLCGKCFPSSTISTCSNSVAIISKPPVTTVGTKVPETTQSFGLRNGASRSVFSVATAILAVLVFLM